MLIRFLLALGYEEKHANLNFDDFYGNLLGCIWKTRRREMNTRGIEMTGEGGMEIDSRGFRNWVLGNKKGRSKNGDKVNTNKY